MLLSALLGLALWIVISIPVALYFVRAMALEEGAPEAAEIQDAAMRLDPSGPLPPPHTAVPQQLRPRQRTGAAA